MCVIYCCRVKRARREDLETARGRERREPKKTHTHTREKRYREVWGRKEGMRGAKRSVGGETEQDREDEEG